MTYPKRPTLDDLKRENGERPDPIPDLIARIERLERLHLIVTGQPTSKVAD